MKWRNLTTAATAHQARRKLLVYAAICLVAAVCGRSNTWAQSAGEDDFKKQYEQRIQPLVQQFCVECHAGEEAEAEIDLARLKSFIDAAADPKLWIKVREMLESGQMPPKESAQPTEAEAALLKDWVRRYLSNEAEARAGDPGPVILRRLTNAEYNYTIHDLTGVNSLNPTREFPVDGAAGEGFTNAGSAQGMSPALVSKYLDAAREIADHAVLLPDGIRFSPHTSERDRSDELLARIQEFYRQFTEDGGGLTVDLQGIKFDTNQGGLLPLKRYLEATLAEREALLAGKTSLEEVAHQRGLSVRYLTKLWQTLKAEEDAARSPLLAQVKAKWRQSNFEGARVLADEISQAQKQWWKFNSIGHIGRVDGPTSWLEATTPLSSRRELKSPLPQSSAGDDVIVHLVCSDLGDGNPNDYLIWENPRLVYPPEKGQPPIALRDLRSLTAKVRETIADESAKTEQYLDALASATSMNTPLSQLAQSRGLNAELLRAWAKLTGLEAGSAPEIVGHYQERLQRVAGYEAINGWGSPSTPSLLANRSKEDVSYLTFTIPARGVTVHPSPTLESVVAWKSPFDGEVRIEALVADVDLNCGNGAAWYVEIANASGVTRIAEAVTTNQPQRFQSENSYAVKKGDVVTLVVNPIAGNHSCDTTHVDLTLTEVGGEARQWNLSSDIVDDVLAANPLPDKHGHKETWHFCSRPIAPPTAAACIPLDSALFHWRQAVVNHSPREKINDLAKEVAAVLASPDPQSLSKADRETRRLLLDWTGPLRWLAVCENAVPQNSSEYGVDPSLFGKHPNGSSIDPSSLCVQAPKELKVRIPAELAAEAQLVVSGVLHPQTAKEASVQIRLSTAGPSDSAIALGDPILVGEGTDVRQRIQSAVGAFRDLFPPALCYARIVPVDEVVTLTLYHREDDHLQRLMLNDEQTAELNRLWEELRFVSQEPLKLVVAYEQIVEFATQDRPDLVKAFQPLKGPIEERAAQFRQKLAESEPLHVQAVLEIADRAWRRPLSEEEAASLRSLYQQLRQSELPHDEAIRLTLARVLASPAFLYKRETPKPGASQGPVASHELATRLSYFLWSSMPDAALRKSADAGDLLREEELLAQTRRMLADDRIRRLAVQFACQWLHIRDFDQTVEKNENLYPEFTDLRRDMYEETVRFIENLCRDNGSILELLDSDHTYLNETMARLYGVDEVKGPQWQRVAGMKTRGRGGVLGMATVLASQSGASRTSPILRGTWVSETLLGERLPRPPADVPVLPDAVPAGLTTRQLIEMHSSVPACAKCHAKIDPYGFALEQFDAIGRMRPEPADTKTTLVDGKAIEGIAGLRHYLAVDRRDDFVRQFCKKLLGFALGREVQLSDEPLLEKMHRELQAKDFRFHTAVETIVTSRQFREIRGAEYAGDE